MTKLSVNLNKVALIRNSRDTTIPSVVEAAKTVIEAGAEALRFTPVLISDTLDLATFMIWPIFSLTPNTKKLNSTLKAILTRGLSLMAILGSWRWWKKPTLIKRL
jgi:hypothetical protein